MRAIPCPCAAAGAFHLASRRIALSAVFATAFISILIQHGVGGAMCVPSITGWLPASVAAPLARHGAMCELGWEVQDTLIRMGQIFFGGEAGRKMNPTPLLVIFFIHHCTAMGMVIPMNLCVPPALSLSLSLSLLHPERPLLGRFYGDSVLYHEMVFLLEGAAFVAMGMQNFGCTSDIPIVHPPPIRPPPRLRSHLIVAMS